jgi:glycerol-3-phosphate dehydrogenase
VLSIERVAGRLPDVQLDLPRDGFVRAVGEDRQWDVVVIGGGATGLGVAVESQSRGYRTLLLEAEDFAKATSSRSTKLVHGGVRYLRQGNLHLVLEALRERGRMLRNAPHLAHRRSFIIPAYRYWELPFYGIGLTLYDLLAGRERIGRSRLLSRANTLHALPSVRRNNLKGGILYCDGQFDDSRYAIALLRTFVDLGGIALNYAPVTGLTKKSQMIAGVGANDLETGNSFHCRTKVVINAAGIFADRVRAMDDPGAPHMLSVSQGSHIVLPRAFLDSDSALMIPRTADGRVLFAIPWHDHVLVGTTDDPVSEPLYDPQPMRDERKFLLDHVERFLGVRPSERDILSTWSGQRPLVSRAGARQTSAISRDHTIVVSESRLFTITGGKWTTYRRMAQDVVDRAASSCGLSPAPSRTSSLRLRGWVEGLDPSKWESVYGSDLPQLRALAQPNPALSEELIPGMPFLKAEVVWAVRYEMARQVDDVLARRTRALFLNARGALACAPEVARIMASELGRDESWAQAQIAAFTAVAEKYIWRD